MSEEKLPKCPLCGGEACVVNNAKRKLADGKQITGTLISCTNCNVSLFNRNPRLAIEAWNRRDADTGKTITCFKCHGAGVYGVPHLDDNGEWDGRLDVCRCEVCGHTGKITLAWYEKLQQGMRDKE